MVHICTFCSLPRRVAMWAAFREICPMMALCAASCQQAQPPCLRAMLMLSRSYINHTFGNFRKLHRLLHQNHPPRARITPKWEEPQQPASLMSKMWVKSKVCLLCSRQGLAAPADGVIPLALLVVSLHPKT